MFSGSLCLFPTTRGIHVLDTESGRLHGGEERSFHFGWRRPGGVRLFAVGGRVVAVRQERAWVLELK